MRNNQNSNIEIPRNQKRATIKTQNIEIPGNQSKGKIKTQIYRYHVIKQEEQSKFKI